MARSKKNDGADPTTTQDPTQDPTLTTAPAAGDGGNGDGGNGGDGGNNGGSAPENDLDRLLTIATDKTKKAVGAKDNVDADTGLVMTSSVTESSQQVTETVSAKVALGRHTTTKNVAANS